MAATDGKLPLGWILAGLGCLGLAGTATLVAVGAAAWLSRSSAAGHASRAQRRRPAGGVTQCPVTQDRASNGEKIDPELAHDLIVCLWQKPAPPGLDGAVSVQVSNLQVGQKRKWVPFEDLGSGNTETWVWPVRATYSMRTDYHTQAVVSTNDAVFNCYVDAFNAWECGLGQSLTHNELQHIPK